MATKKESDDDLNVGIDELKEQLQNELEEIKKIKEEYQKKIDVKPEDNKSSTIDRNQLIKVRNITNSKVCWESPRTQAIYILENFNTQEWIEFGELITLKSRFSKVLTEPWILIEDNEEVINYLGLKTVYENIIPINELNTFFDKSITDMKKVLKSLPNGIKDLLIARSYEMVRTNRLVDVRKIQFIEKEFDINLLETVILQKDNEK
jgi:hypothetical protein